MLLPTTKAPAMLPTTKAPSAGYGHAKDTRNRPMHAAIMPTAACDSAAAFFVHTRRMARVSTGGHNAYSCRLPLSSVCSDLCDAAQTEEYQRRAFFGFYYCGPFRSVRLFSSLIGSCTHSSLPESDLALRGVPQNLAKEKRKCVPYGSSAQ